MRDEVDKSTGLIWLSYISTVYNPLCIHVNHVSSCAGMCHPWSAS